MNAFGTTHAVGCIVNVPRSERYYFTETIASPQVDIKSYVKSCAYYHMHSLWPNTNDLILFGSDVNTTPSLEVLRDPSPQTYVITGPILPPYSLAHFKVWNNSNEVKYDGSKFTIITLKMAQKFERKRKSNFRYLSILIVISIIIGYAYRNHSCWNHPIFVAWIIPLIKSVISVKSILTYLAMPKIIAFTRYHFGNRLPVRR